MDKGTEKRLMALKAMKERPADALFGEPLEFLFADHFRQRVLCTVLDDMAADGPGDREIRTAVLAFLKRDFGLHVLDEEEDLFPLLRRRAEPDDRIKDVLGELSAEHSKDKEDCDLICNRLEAGSLTRRDKDLFRRFASNERHHLVIENGIVLPLARARLNKGDLASLGMRMAARRGVVFAGLRQ